MPDDADRTRNPNDPSQSTDPYQEPPNSTVEDWHGQVVDRAAEEADDALARGAGAEEAEQRYNKTIDQEKDRTERGREPFDKAE